MEENKVTYPKKKKLQIDSISKQINDSCISKIRISKVLVAQKDVPTKGNSEKLYGLDYEIPKKKCKKYKKKVSSHGVE